MPQYPKISQPQFSSADSNIVAESEPSPTGAGAVASALRNVLAKAQTLRSAQNLLQAQILLRVQTLPSAKPAPDCRDERMLARHEFSLSLSSLSSSGIVLTPEQRQPLQKELEAITSKEPRLQGSMSLHFISDEDLWDAISKAIGNIENGYLDVYENVVARYTAFYQAFSDILAQKGGWVSPGSSADKVKLNVKDFESALLSLMVKFSLPSKDAILFPKVDENGNVGEATQQQAKEWAKELGLPESCVNEYPAGSGKYVVVIDMGPVSTMITELNKLGKPDDDGNVELDNAKFQAWQSGFNSQEESLKNTLQTLAQKYSNANSVYDNLVKVLSSTISACLQTCESYLSR
ncbi:type III secretion system needle tip protein SctA [Chromobacterium amazonense]|uniref:type III secretion system needle tip protein SctA n=1 Tax=Chromobacterium amazonense TaxID=1382803 RepID=UPI003F79D0AA